MNKQTKKLIISSAILVGLLVGQTHAAYKPQPIKPPTVKKGEKYKPQPIKSPIVKKGNKYKPLKK